MLVTGSSAALLSREVATALRGRGWWVLIHPFSFDEALRHQGRSVPDDAAVLTGRERTRLERALLDWLGVGGFPEAQAQDGLPADPPAGVEMQSACEWLLQGAHRITSR